MSNSGTDPRTSGQKALYHYYESEKEPEVFHPFAFQRSLLDFLGKKLNFIYEPESRKKRIV